MKRNVVSRALTAAFLLAMAPFHLSAQLRAPTPVSSPTLRLGWARPFMSGESDWGLPTSVLSARLSLPVNATLLVFTDAALAHATLRSSSSTTLANARLGFVAGRENRTHGVVAVTLPTQREWGDDDYAGLVGFLTEVERVESFLGRTFAVEAAIHPTWVDTTTGVAAGARLGGTYTSWLDRDADDEVFGRYSAFIKSPEAAVRVGAELSGVAIVSERNLSFSERTVHWLTLSGGLGKLRGEPTVTVRIPLDEEYRSDLKTVIGVTIDIG